MSLKRARERGNNGRARVENRIRRKTFAAIDFINFLMDFTFSAVEDFNISDKYLCVGLGGWLGGRLRIRIRGYRLGTVLAVVVVTLSATESGLSRPCSFFLWTGIDYDWQMALSVEGSFVYVCPGNLCDCINCP